MKKTLTDNPILETDFVIVGAGSGGAALAARLTESPRCRVILLEAGPVDRRRHIQVPWGFGKLFASPDLNWCYNTQPDPNLQGRRIFWPRGKVLGGSSSINGMIYIRGQREDFDGWSRMGNPGWSFDEVLPFFKRSEDQCRGPDGYHGTGGPQRVSDIRPDMLGDAFIEAAIQGGFVHNPDFNGAVQDGVGYHQATIRCGRRESSATAYLSGAIRRPNLQIMTSARVEKVVVTDRAATGVLVSYRGRRLEICAKREVVLSAGAVESPKLLLLSGIGPSETLQKLGVPVISNLAGVGRNLQDHYSAAIKVRSRVRTLNDTFHSPVRRAQASIRYALCGTGALALPVVSVGLFARTRETEATPDIKCSFSPFSTDRPQDGLHEWSGFSLLTFQLRPESRGRIELRSSRSEDAPLIHPNYLAAEKDRNTIVEALKISRRILKSAPMRDLVTAEYLPGDQIKSDDELLAYARQYGTTVFHPTSTCRMGIDPSAVVDPRLRVRGIKNLRVVDASIMPSIPSGNTNAPTIMIAEKAADMILTDQRLSH